MINGQVDEIKTQLKFTLSNGEVFILNDSRYSVNNDNYLSSIQLNEEIKSDNNISIGVNSSNTLDIVIVTNNKALIPENENSVYYGYMNDTAIIEVYITESNDTLYFGKYYVKSWTSNITSDTPNNVNISAVCIMSVISEQTVPDVLINSGIKIKDYLIALIEELNNKLDSNHQINYNDSDIKFDEFPTMQFSNLDTENMGNCLNGLSQCTLTNIYTDRNNYIKTDYNCDDSGSEAVYELNVMVSADAGSNNLINYDGLKINYSLGNILDVEQIASLYQQDVTPGDNTFSDISLGEALYKVNRIEVTAEDENIYVGVKSATYNKNKMSLVVESDATTKVNITIYGQRLDTTSLVYETEGKNKLEITNKVLFSTYIEKYATELNKLLNYKNNCIEIKGYFNPRIKLTDIVYVNCENAMGISGYYKVIAMDWDLGMFGVCTMKLMKTFNTQFDLNAIMNNLNELLELNINGQFNTIYTYAGLSDTENNYVNQQLGTELDELRDLLYGEE